ncbi:NtaA/DmoA family FMN-dependent monooxygenase [Subtercola sp. YIM 133946]|uniref:NtaA/DmoA family FMN-dependent monooxygenase n=1 Tax=Subtercola sp. YIM 133946 TaxID=3118909 RepID=UPI002F94D005
MTPLILGIFQYIGPNGTVGSAWQHPADTSADFLKISHWTTLARTFDQAGLDFLFLADSYGYPALNGELLEASVREGRGIPHGDPMPIVTAMAAVTEKLGFILTTSTTVEAPAANARRFATLDHFTDGRIGWNIVTGSSGATAAALMGKELISHDLRYDMADEYVDVNLALWEGSWADDALVLDKAAAVYADPAGVRLVHYEGRYFATDGLLNVPPSPQRTPLLVQAGASGRGRRFAGRNAEAVFLAGGDPAVVRANIEGIRAAAIAEGRGAEAIKMLVGALFITAPTHDEAVSKYDEMLAMSTPEGAAAIYAGNTGIDLLALDPDLPLQQLNTEMGQSNLERYLGSDGRPAPLVRDILENFRTTGINGSVFVGSPDEVVDQAEAFIAETGADGFLLQPHLTPQTYDDFIGLILPVMRARGLAKPALEAETLRERMFGAGPHLPPDHHGRRFAFGA